MKEATFRLHPAQQDVFIDQLINVNSPQYNIGGYIILKGTLEKDKLRETIETSPGIFDVFKMRFDANAPDLIGYTDEDYKVFELGEIDFSDKSDPRNHALEWMQERMNIPFPFDKKRCSFEQVLIKISANEHWLLGRFHHLVMDGYGFIVWVQYMARKYRALVTSENISFTYPSYLNEAAMANEPASGSHQVTHDDYWIEKIKTKPGKIFNKKDARQNKSEKPGAIFNFNISETQRSELEELTVTTKASLQQLTIAALLVYFGNISPGKKFIFGIPVHKRNSRKLRSIVGLFNSFLPFEGFFEKDTTLLDLIRSVASSQAKDYRHQDYKTGNLLRHLQLNPAEENLWDVIVNYLPLNFELDFGKEIDASIFRLVNEFEKTPLQVCWNDYGKQQALELQIHFSKEYFDPDEIKFLAQRLLFILDQFSNDQGKIVDTIGILPIEERMLLENFSHLKLKPGDVPFLLPFENYQLCILNEEGRLLPIGIEGDLYFVEASEGKISAAITFENFSEKLFDTRSEKFYKTGQQARWTTAGKIGFIMHNVSVKEHEEKPITINIASTFVAEPLEEYINYWSKEFELNLAVNFAPYNQVFQQLLDRNSLLNNAEGINIILLRVEDWLRDKQELSSAAQVEFLEQIYEQLITALEEARKLSGKPYLLGIVPWILNQNFSPEIEAKIFELNGKISAIIEGVSLFYRLDLSK
ncbi:MAG: condensation domain-containing protein, partial [Chitinophagaceae bacterium]